MYSLINSADVSFTYHKWNC